MGLYIGIIIAGCNYIIIPTCLTYQRAADAAGACVGGARHRPFRPLSPFRPSVPHTQSDDDIGCLYKVILEDTS